MDDKQLAKLIRQNSAKATRAQKKPARKYDATLPPREEGAVEDERKQFFDEMKRREF
ncbi:MAG: hypothetical protein ACR2G6_07800 [Gemmatimonadaceae bacterium]